MTAPNAVFCCNQKFQVHTIGIYKPIFILKFKIVLPQTNTNISSPNNLLDIMVKI